MNAEIQRHSLAPSMKTRSTLPVYIYGAAMDWPFQSLTMPTRPVLKWHTIMPRYKSTTERRCTLNELISFASENLRFAINARSS